MMLLVQSHGFDVANILCSMKKCKWCTNSTAYLSMAHTPRLPYLYTTNLPVYTKPPTLSSRTTGYIVPLPLPHHPPSPQLTTHPPPQP